MGGLSTSLLIGVQALEANQGALNATSNNIANANTPGYTREVAQFSENQESLTGGTVIGGGVSVLLIALSGEIEMIEVPMPAGLACGLPQLPVRKVAEHA